MTEKRIAARACIYSLGNADEYIDAVIHHPGGDIHVRLYPDGRSVILDMGDDYRTTNYEPFA